MSIPTTVQRDILENKFSNSIIESSSLNRKLVSFQMSKKVPFYRLFPFKEAFSPQMVEMFIKEYPKNTGRVLDPFSGTGTTLFSAKEMGFDSVGIELLPIGEFVFKSRKAAENVDLNILLKTIKQIKSLNFSALPTDPETSFKHIKITEKAFPEETENKLNAYINYINNEIPDGNVAQLLKFACFCILEPISYTLKSGQYLRWDARAGKTKTKFEKKKIYGFEEALYTKLDDIIQDINGYNLFSCSSQNTDSENGKIELMRGSCLEVMPSLPANSFDLVISSPPYCNRYDYTRTYALELTFLGVSGDKIKDLRQSLLSCTVENKDKIELLKKIYRKDNFKKIENTFYSIEALQETLQILEDYKNQKKLNNPGIHRMVKNYFYEHCFAIFEFNRLLKDGGRVYYVNDNVRYAGEIIPVDLILSEIAIKLGFKDSDIIKLPKGKGNSSQQMKSHGKQEVRKSICIWKK